MREDYPGALAVDSELHWYRIVDVLGQGGFGITYLAHDANLDQLVALKEYLPAEFAVRAADDQVQARAPAQEERFRWGLSRFLREARMLARFDHPNIVRVLSVFEHHGTAYLVMRYEQGRNLASLLDAEGTLPEEQLREILLPLLDGLAKIHAAGVIHRDIKPENIYLRVDGSPVLLDFGSARQALGSARTMTILVAPGYAPFEQYYSHAHEQGPWTDIYSLGATLYRAMTGIVPVDAIQRSRGVLGRTRDLLAPVAEVAQRSYSPSLLRAVQHALCFDEQARPRTVEQWRLDLDGTAPAEAATGASTGDMSAATTPDAQDPDTTVPPVPGAGAVPWLLVALALLVGAGLASIPAVSEQLLARQSGESIEQLRQSIDNTRAALASEQAALRDARGLTALERSSRDALREQHAQQQTQRDALDADIERAHEALAEADAKLQSGRDQAAQAARDVAEMSHKLDILRAERDTLVDALTPMRAERDTLADALATMRAEHETLAAALATMRTEHDTLVDALTPMRAERETLVDALAPMRAERETLAAALVTMRTERDTLAVALAPMRTEQAALVQELGDLRRRLAATAKTSARKPARLTNSLATTQPNPVEQVAHRSALDLAREDYTRGAFGEARAKLVPLADNGSVDASALLARIYLDGSGVPRAPCRAQKYLQTAAAGGQLEAARELGQILAGTACGARDLVQAKRWLGEAADGGDPDAQLRLAMLLGPVSDPFRAYALVYAAAQCGHKKALVALAQWRQQAIVKTFQSNAEHHARRYMRCKPTQR